LQNSTQPIGGRAVSPMATWIGRSGAATAAAAPSTAMMAAANTVPNAPFDVFDIANPCPRLVGAIFLTKLLYWR
jgi:hypothetical protein